MDFKKTSQLGSLISKDYAKDFLKLLVIYQDISASEAASRLNLHTKTAQDFLEGLSDQGIVSKNEVFEKKRPYFRYSLNKKKLTIDIELSDLYRPKDTQDRLKWPIREKKNSGAMFKTFGKSDHISAVHFFVGKGRTRDERTLNLTTNQGKFLFHLPFPTQSFKSVADIVKKAEVDESYVPEILDIVEVLVQYKIIERAKGSV
jgi:predicted transcriptional regulator